MHNQFFLSLIHGFLTFLNSNPKGWRKKSCANHIAISNAFRTTQRLNSKKTRFVPRLYYAFSKGCFGNRARSSSSFVSPKQWLDVCARPPTAFSHIDLSQSLARSPDSFPPFGIIPVFLLAIELPANFARKEAEDRKKKWNPRIEKLVEWSEALGLLHVFRLL